MTSDGAARRLPAVTLAVLAATAIACLIWSATVRGIWLDEFWSLHYGRQAAIIPVLAGEWLRDTHPPLANLLYRTVTALGVDTIVGRRLSLNLPALLFMIVCTAAFARVRGQWRLFPVALFIVAMALPGTMLGFSEYRSYGWQVAAMVAVLCYAELVLDRDRPVVRWFHHALGLTGIALALMLHYVAGIVASVFIGLLLIALWRARRLRVLVAVLVVAGLAGGTTLASGLTLLASMQASIDYGWIATTTGTAVALFAFLAAGVVLANPVLAVVGATQRRAPSRFVLLCALTLAVSALVLIALNARTPIVVERYLLLWQVIGAAAVAGLAVGTLRARPAVFAAAGLVAVAMLVLATRTAGTQDGWNRNADWIAAEVARCPTTRVHAVSPLRFRTVRDTKLAARETAIIVGAYTELGRDRGFAVTVMPLTGPAELPPPGVCPVLLWVEHLDWRDVGSVARFARIGQLALPTSTRATVRANDSGFVVRLDAGEGSSEELGRRQ